MYLINNPAVKGNRIRAAGDEEALEQAKCGDEKEGFFEHILVFNISQLNSSFIRILNHCNISPFSQFWLAYNFYTSSLEISYHSIQVFNKHQDPSTTVHIKQTRLRCELNPSA